MCHHTLIGRQFYGYYGFVCRPSVHRSRIAASLRAYGVVVTPTQIGRPFHRVRSTAVSSPNHLHYLGHLRKGFWVLPFDGGSPCLTSALRRFIFIWLAILTPASSGSLIGHVDGLLISFAEQPPQVSSGTLAFVYTLPPF